MLKGVEREQRARLTRSEGVEPQHPESAKANEAQTRLRIERAITRARAVLLWESLWPNLAPLLVLAAAYLTLSWFGMWRVVPDWPRFAILAVFAAVALFFLLRALRTPLPGRAAALARVEAASGARHRPATAFTDRLVSAPDDPVARTLWEAHRTRLLGLLERLKAGVPAPRLAARDPYALRFLAALLFVVAFLYAGPERWQRAGEGFRGGETTAATLARIDAWVTPPAYTGRAPVFLTGASARPVGTVYSVPEGSIVAVRTGGDRNLSVISISPEGETPAEIAAEAKDTPVASDAAAPVQHQVTLSGEARVAIRRGDNEVASWRFAVQPDDAPQIAFAREPTTTPSGALSLAYTLEDDYGIVAAEALIEPATSDVAAAPGSEARPLYTAPTFPLTLPQLRARSGGGETVRDLTAHPWAGADVLLTLVARDDAEQEGRSPAQEITLPARRFTQPLARAIVEQRTRLALDANAADSVSEALDALTLAPEKSIKDSGNYLALRSAYHRLNLARNDDDLRGIVDYLWDIALGIEDGDMSLAAQALRDAQEALQEALDEGASDEEIERLTQELREAMQEFLQALAEEIRRNPQMGQLPPDANVQTFRQRDLERMLDRIEDLARSGARDAARQMLSELQNMLESLQAGRSQRGNPQAGEMMQSLNQLGEMIRRQQQLMDQTHRADRNLGGEDGQPGEMTQEQLEQALRELQEGQQSLQQALQEFMQQMQGMGMQDENGKLGQAGEAMGEAAEALGEGHPGGAIGRQSEALEALRQGAQGLAQQFAERGQGPGPGGIRGGENFPNEDPLGRPQRTTGPDLGTQVRVPDEIDTQRAREILDTIRRRLSEPTRPQSERDYLERLLDRF